MLRKISVLSIGLIFITSFLHAQVSVNYGVKGGVNIFSFLGDDAPSASGLTAPYAGGLAQISFGGDEGIISYVFQPELFYSMQGAKSSGGKTTLSYLQFPLMVQRYIASTGLYIETGPQFGLLLSAKSKANGTTTDIKDQSKKFDFSLNFGLGYKFNSGIGINARYGFGVTSVSSNSDVHNAGISAGIFYVFGQNRDDY
ncbi:MAG: porin family protein [Chitinophagaceae bacterium]|nr:porin family protein [Chitinophagaceae bacterium]